MKKYICNIPYCSLPMVVYADIESDARRVLRSKLCVNRLPNGTKLYAQVDAK